MADVQFDEGGIPTTQSYSTDGTNESKGMVGWLIKVSGGKLTPQTANIFLAIVGVLMILLSIVILWRM